MVGWGLFNLGDIIKTLDFVAFTVNLLALNQFDIFERSWFIFCVSVSIGAGSMGAGGAATPPGIFFAPLDHLCPPPPALGSNY